MKKLKSWYVFGWDNGEDYDAGNGPDYSVKVNAKDEADAEDKGSNKIEKLHGKCDVITAQYDEENEA